MKITCHFKEERAVVGCPRCNSPAFLRYAVDRVQTASRAEILRAKFPGSTTIDPVFQTTPYAITCNACRWTIRLKRFFHRNYTPTSTNLDSDQ